MIGDNIVVMVVEIRGDKVRLAFDAPKDIIIHREEVYLQVQEEKKNAKSTETGPTSEST